MLLSVVIDDNARYVSRSRRREEVSHRAFQWLVVVGQQGDAEQAQGGVVEDGVGRPGGGPGRDQVRRLYRLDPVRARPAAARTSRAKPYQVVGPRLVT